MPTCYDIIQGIMSASVEGSDVLLASVDDLLTESPVLLVC